MSVVSRTLLRQHVAALLDELEARRGPEVLSVLAVDPIAELRTWTDITVQEVPSNPSPTCDVAGAFLAETDPPTVVIARATSPGRRCFTALHELGHYLYAMSDPLIEVLLDQPDGGKALEEASCDGFAAQILIPDSTAAAHLVGGVTADGVRRLYQAVSASRSAVCVAASRLLHVPGHVTLLDSAGRVIIDAAVGRPRLRQGSDQASAELIARALRSPEHSATGRLRFQYRNRIEGPELYAQVCALDEYFVVVAMTDHAPWLSFAPPPADDGPTARTWSCEHCPAEFEVWERPCQRCSTPKCPECGRCGCAVRERRCTECFQVYGLAMFDGDSTVCKEHD